MAEGIRLVSINRGVDPRSFTLVAFGGAGALHATALARELDIGSIIVPRYAGVLSALGLLSAKIEHEASAAFLETIESADTGAIARICRSLQQQCESRMQDELVPAADVETTFYADVCYVGQAHSIEVPIAPYEPTGMLDAAYEAFCALHDRIYGHSTRSPARFVNLRAVQRAANRLAAPTRPAPTEPASPKGRRSVLLESVTEPIDAAVFERDGLAPGQVVPGPAIVEQSDTTTLIDAGWQAEVLGDQVLHLTRAPV
jgi:N-methylhydantoinase A/oxoprolinase/acetone carboxylase beta subunit